MICEAPTQRGPNKGLPATGTAAGYTRHQKVGEPACPDCLTANAEYHRQWNAINPEKRSDYIRRWEAANPQKRLEHDRRRYATNPQKKHELNRRRRARETDALTIPFTPDQLAQRMAYWGNRCYMCGGPFEHVDHFIPLALGGPHCLSNLRPACGSCNSSKGARRVT
jgi:5-methylcytosine-specific restriction endonuclease McrA